MNKEFLKFKKKIQIEALIKSIVAGLSSSLLIIGIILLTIKLTNNLLPIWLYIIIGIAVFLVVGALFYLIIRPKDIEVAKRMDQDLMLNQKVQTMVEYKDEEGLMLDIQREDTNEILSKIEPKKLRWRFHFMYIVLLVVALSISITSFAIPAKADGNDSTVPTEPSYEEDAYTVARLKELIKYVKESETDEVFKNPTVVALSELLDLVLEENTTLSMIQMNASALIEGMNTSVKLANTSDLVFEVLKNEIDANVVNLVYSLKNLDRLGTIKVFGDLKSQLTSNKDIAINVAKPLGNALGKVLANSELNKQELYKKSPLIIALVGFGKDINDFAIKLEKNNELINDEALLLIDKHQLAVSNALSLQLNNIAVKDYVASELDELFDLSEEDDDEAKPKPSKPSKPSDAPSSSSTVKGNEEGGIGGGDIIYGSDDKFFDPVLGYVRYGDVINAYQAIIDKDAKDGVLTQEMIEFYREYYEKLMTNNKE